MNRINPNKLLHSKWTAVSPRDREKHFLVVGCERDHEDQVTAVEIEAVLTRRSEILPWQQLKDSARWLMGWR